MSLACLCYEIFIFGAWEEYFCGNMKLNCVSGGNQSAISRAICFGKPFNWFSVNVLWLAVEDKLFMKEH